MKRIIGCALSALVSFSTLAASDFDEPDPKQWVHVTSMPDGTSRIYAKIGSFVQGKVSRSMIIQHFTSPNPKVVNYTVTYSKVSVSNKDCQSQYGKVVITSLQGKELFTGDFIRGGGSGASVVANVLCDQ